LAYLSKFIIPELLSWDGRLLTVLDSLYIMIVSVLIVLQVTTILAYMSILLCQ